MTRPQGAFARVNFNSSLSDEIKAEIFRSACFVDGDTSDQAFISPLKLILVCRLWRDFITSSPPLWSTIVLTAGYGSDDKAVRVLRTHLKYSESLPLRIYVIIPTDQAALRRRGHPLFSRPRNHTSKDGLVLPIEISMVVDLLITVVGRIQHLAILGGAGSPWSVITTKFKALFLSNFPILEVIELVNLGWSFPDVDKYFEPFGEKSPCLQTVALTGMGRAASGLFSHFKDITDLRLANISVENCINAISRFQKLQNLSVSSIAENGLTSLRETRSICFGVKVKNNSLIALTITDSFEDDTIIILTQTALPALRYMDIRGIYQHSKLRGRKTEAKENEFMKTFEKFLEQSTCSLRTLAIDQRDAWWRILNHVHTTLEEFYLEPGDKILRADVLFGRMNYSATYLPQLQLLHFVNVSFMFWDNSIALDVLSTRRKMGSNLALVVEFADFIVGFSIPNSTIIEGFNKLIKEGSYISFRLSNCDKKESKKIKAEFIDKLLSC